MMTCSQVTWDRTRTFAVSWVPHWRANVSKATSRTRECSRASVVGRRKSYTSTVPACFAGRPLLNCSWTVTVGTIGRALGDVSPPRLLAGTALRLSCPGFSGGRAADHGRDERPDAVGLVREDDDI